MLNEDFTDLFGDVVHLSAIAATQGVATFGVVANFDVGVIGMTDVNSHNRYPLSFFYIYYTLEFEKSQVKK